MGRRHPNPRLVKVHRPYTVEQLARLFGKHKNTVLRWRREGLPAVDAKRPILFEGKAVQDFLRARRAKAKKPCPPGHLYCVRCREPKPPAGGLLECIAISDTLVDVRAICPTCQGMIYRRANSTKSPWLRGEPITHARVRIRDSETPSVNGDSKPRRNP